MFNTILIGLGNIGLNYDLKSKKVFTHTKALILNKKTKLICGVDKNKTQAKKFNKKYKIPAFENLNEIKNLENIRLAIISVNENNHLKVINQIISLKKLKIILIEKPCGKNFKEFLEIKKKCKNRGIKLFINFQRIYSKQFSILNKYIKKLNNFSGTAYYSRGLRNNLGHIFSLLSALDLKKCKIKIISKKKFPDFILNFKNGRIVFLSLKNQNLSNNEFEIFDKNLKITSYNELNKFFIFHSTKDSLIKKNFIFKKKHVINFNEKTPQMDVLKYILRKSNNNIEHIFFDTLKLLESIKN